MNDYEKRVICRCLECDAEHERLQWKVRNSRCDVETEDGSECGGRLNGFDVIPGISTDLPNLRVCLGVAANDLNVYQFGGIPWLPFEEGTKVIAGFEDWPSLEDLYWKLGYKLREECLAYMKAKKANQTRV